MGSAIAKAEGDRSWSVPIPSHRIELVAIACEKVALALKKTTSDIRRNVSNSLATVVCRLKPIGISAAIAPLIIQPW
jgi:hypothetical protein